MKKEYYEIIIAALLHDIGKFKERAFGGKEHEHFPKTMEGMVLPLTQDGRYSHRHALWTFDFFENDCKHFKLPKELDWIKIRNMAAMHHKASNDDEKIIDKADKISAASDRSDETDYVKGGHLKRHLRSVFTRIKLEHSIDGLYGYALKPLTSDNVFPVEISDESASLQAKYKNLWDEFIVKCEESLNNYKPAMGLTHFVHILLSLLQKYCWCIPSATNDAYRDISLYDHAITTAAIALVLKINQNEKATPEKPFLFFAGDLSGIQQYIFQHQQQSYHGTSKIIRGRSLYLSMISHAYCYALCEALQIPPFVQLMNAGGKFTLILPNLPQIKDKIKKFTSEADNWFFNTFHGDFTVVYDYSIEAAEDDMRLQLFKKIIQSINYKLALAKSQKFSEILKSGQCVINIDYNEEELCKSCGRYSPAEGLEEQRCNICNDMFKVGTKLTKNSILAFHKQKGDIEYFDKKISMSIFDSVDTIQEPIAIFTFDESQHLLPVIFCNNYVPQKDNQTLTFEEIANTALQRNDDGEQSVLVGSSFLSYIKIDVDNMGGIFSQGIEDLSVSRYVSLSRMMHVFFNVVVKDVIENNFKNVYTVFSGGDDLFVITPWNLSLHFVSKLQQKFKDFVCNHPDLHFSTGVVIQKPNYPMNKVAALAEHKLEQAKNAGRNKINYFNTILLYKDLHNIHEDAKWFIEENNNEQSKIKHSFLYRLLRYTRMAKKVHSQKFMPNDLLYIPSFKYDVSRNIVIKGKDSNNKEIIVNAKQLQWLEQRFEHYTKQGPHILEVILSIALYQTREKRI